MKQYTIYCTPEQTKKALELGAPILAFKNAFGSKEIPYFTVRENNEWTLYVCPTAEQMMEWLRTKGFRFKIIEYDKETYWQIHYDGTNWLNHGETIKYEEATLSAIDAAFEYLIKNGE